MCIRDRAEIVFANRVQTVLDYTDTVICCDIHTRQRSKRLLKKAGARVVLGLDLSLIHISGSTRPPSPLFFRPGAAIFPPARSMPWRLSLIHI